MNRNTNLRRSLLLTLAVIGLAFSNAGFANNEGIRVSGTGTVYGEPDTATFTVGINTVSDDVSEATQESNEVAEAIIQSLQDAGVVESDIQTSSFNVFREDSRTEDGDQQDPQFRVINTLTVTVRDVGVTGELLSLALDSGANQVNNLQFTISDAEGLRAEARALAVQDALKRAGHLAELAEVELGSPVFIEEFHAGGPMMAARQSMAFSEAASVPIESGELSVSVDVNVVFAINHPWSPLR